MKKHLFTILIGAASMVTGSPARAQNIVATHDAYGHTVWVASDEAKPQSEPQATDSKPFLKPLFLKTRKPSRQRP